MSDLVSIAFPTEAAAEEVRKKLLDMQQEYLIELGDAVIAVKQPNGGVKLNQLFHPTAAGAATGAFWGTLIGLIFLMALQPVGGMISDKVGRKPLLLWFGFGGLFYTYVLRLSFRIARVNVLMLLSVRFFLFLVVFVAFFCFFESRAAHERIG